MTNYTLCDERGVIMLDNEYTYFKEDGLEFIIHFCDVLDFCGDDKMLFDIDYNGNPLVLNIGEDFVIV